jgi:hypothetical protein
VAAKSTRLRFIQADTPEDISQTVSALAFKVEIKGAPVLDGKRWVLWFVIPDEQEMMNITL